jgi:putative restriction endonuclease
MEILEGILQNLSNNHQKGLQWFIDHANTEQPWTPSVDDVLLVTKAKGIYKPAWMEYALSIRQVLGGPYPDRDPIARPDGTWIYQYYQEGDNLNDRDDMYTNKALMACWRDRIPVGVMRQVSGKPLVRYNILGVALVAGREDGYFFFEGFSSQGRGRGRGAQAEIDFISTEAAISSIEESKFEPKNLRDARQRVVSSIVRRRGQRQFRQSLLDAYGNRCAVSACSVLETLEAAHIVPYLGPETNHISNGLLLRADLHTLFDLGKIAVESQSMSVIISPDLVGTLYEEFSGKRLYLPADASKRPSLEALNYHRNWSGL